MEEKQSLQLSIEMDTEGKLQISANFSNPLDILLLINETSKVIINQIDKRAKEAIKEEEKSEE